MASQVPEYRFVFCIVGIYCADGSRQEIIPSGDAFCGGNVIGGWRSISPRVRRHFAGLLSYHTITGNKDSQRLVKAKEGSVYKLPSVTWRGK